MLEFRIQKSEPRIQNLSHLPWRERKCQDLALFFDRRANKPIRKIMDLIQGKN
ncbi:hypothetical protein ANRL2_00320 [Anaerolineae bacterium]|nr:hypothetical protein ANRL2_00320 [Anaerolineae bacterium]